ncbi:hypothetical protein AFCA_001260 [Aspergillus flavus]|uniref:Uncharacterized protein n=1 Tax=Aspergillus flavus TaxID=5059 RepID=A0AB74CG31_ASPFL|nr:hypothetical protein CA14_005438 [Aspergillus flavus]UCK58406.1 hypothetical protein AFCA_001260 [Aspergillus flavus]
MKCLRSVASLSKEEVRLLTRVLSIGFIDPDGHEPRDKGEIMRAIKKLPSALQRHWLKDLIGRAPAVALCDLHAKLNPYIIRYVFELLRCEVITHLECLYWYHSVLHDARLDVVDLKVRDIVYSLGDIRYMWTPSRRAIQGSPVTYQQNKCEACVLARIVKGRKFLQHLRTALLSRTATRRNHRVPTFLPFVEESIACHEGFVDKIHWRSSTLATTMKRQRKHAHRALMTSDPVASLKQDLSRTVEGAVVPIGIDPEVLESFQEDQEEGGNHGVRHTISEQVPKKQDSDTDTLAGIVGLYNEPQPLNWIYSPTSCAMESQSDLSSVTYTDDSPTHASPISPKSTSWLAPATSTPDPLRVLSPSTQKKKAPMKEPVDDSNDGQASRYIPPREMPNWKHVLCKPSSLDLFANGGQNLGWEESQGNGGCEQIAAQYRNLLSPAQPYYESEHGELFSESEYEDNPIGNRESQDTNWSFLFRF